MRHPGSLSDYLFKSYSLANTGFYYKQSINVFEWGSKSDVGRTNPEWAGHKYVNGSFCRHSPKVILSNSYI